jgi:hypothetical protein
MSLPVIIFLSIGFFLHWKSDLFGNLAAIGFQYTTSFLCRKQAINRKSRADSAAENARKTPPELAQLAASWESLPEVVKVGILAMVTASHGQSVIPGVEDLVASQ